MAVRVNAPNDIGGIIDTEEELRAVAKMLGTVVRYDPETGACNFILPATSYLSMGFSIVSCSIGVGSWIWLQSNDGTDYSDDFPGRAAPEAHGGVEGDSSD